MPLSPYFLQGSTSEQKLVQDIINEQLRIYGQDIVYLPRKIVNKSTIFKEITASKFDDSFRMEAYLLNYEGFEGSGDVLSKFGVQTTDAVTFVISKQKYEDFITPKLDGSEMEVITRPQEGDLIYFPLDNTIFEIKYVEAKKPFYQLNQLYVYTLSCEVMDMELDEQIETSIEAVNEAVVDFGYIITLSMVGLGAQTAQASLVRASATSGISTGFAVGYIDLINDGTAYTAPPTIGISTAPTIDGERGVDAAAVAIMTSRSGQTGQSLDKILMTNPGYGYTVPPTVTIIPVNQYGSGGIATAVLAHNSLSNITVTTSGSEYGSIVPNTVVDTPAIAAEATSTISSGSVNSLEITNGGRYYGSAPTVTIATPPTGINTATATATVSAAGTISGLSITNAGVGYTIAPVVTISNSGEFKTNVGYATAQVETFLNVNGGVAQIRFSNAGYGYLDTPTITIDPPVIAGLSKGDYLYREKVTGVDSDAVGYVVNWDNDTRILQVNNVSEGNMFIEGEKVVGIGTTLNGSDSAYLVKSINRQDDTDLFGDNTPFETEGDAILDFTEQNPFGEF